MDFEGCFSTYYNGIFYSGIFIVYIFFIGPCSAFPLGIYNVTGQICNGDCGSHHPHTSVYDNGFASFEVTKKTD